MILLARRTPWYRDQGLTASTGFCIFVLLYNVANPSAAGQITGTLAAAPMLAAVLVAVAWRVFLATGVALLTVLLSSAIHPVTWDGSQITRMGLIVVSGIVGFEAARIRLKEKSQLVGMREVARTAQRAIMAMSPPHHDRIEAAMRYASATEQAQIGGDAFETADTPYGLRLLVADARGKGLPAIRTSAVTIGAFREWAHVEADVAEVLLRMDASIAREVEYGDFVTALVGELDDEGTFRFSSAGHPMPLLVRDGAVRPLALQPTPPLSMAAEFGLPQVGEIHLRRGDVVLLYTDGLTEARNRDGDFFPLEHLLPELVEGDRSLEAVADALLDRLREFVRSDLGDDVALVLLRPSLDESGLVGDG